MFGCKSLKLVQTRTEDFAVSPKLSGQVCNSSELVRSDGRRTVWKLQLVRTRPDAIANLQSDRTSLTFFLFRTRLITRPRPNSLRTRPHEFSTCPNSFVDRRRVGWSLHFCMAIVRTKSQFFRTFRGPDERGRI